LGDLVVDASVILRYTLKRQNMKEQTGFIWLRTGTCGGSCEHGNELLGPIKGEKSLDQQNDCHILEKGSAPWN
jgi:hypothetical protein